MCNLNQIQKIRSGKKAFLATLLTVGSTSVALAAEEAAEAPALNDTGLFMALVGLMVLQVVIITVVKDSIKNLAGNKSIWIDTKPKATKSIRGVMLLLGLSFLSGSAYAAGETSNEPLIVMSDTLYWMLISINGLLFCFLLYVLSILKSMITVLRGETEEEKSSVAINLTDAVPIEQEAEIMMDHEYDGIRELDNNLPPWWVYMFYITIAFAGVYLVHYHISPIKMFENVAIIGPGVGQEELYKLEMEEAKRAKEEYMAKMSNLVDETNVEFLTDASALEKGKAIFIANCTPCHGAAGEGNTIGPNLTDEYWLNGGGIKNIFKTIKYGVPVKGMREWQSQFSPGQIQQIASFVWSLQGSNPPNSKDFQG